MVDRVYLSIGDVLNLLREEFPDVTISKIRFLESQGLLDPERTPSGYRKFYGEDVDRLRWILRQQRENFLPLKVIKGRLEGDDPDGEPNAPLPLGSVDPAPPADLVGATRSRPSPRRGQPSRSRDQSRSGDNVPANRSPSPAPAQLASTTPASRRTDRSVLAVPDPAGKSGLMTPARQAPGSDVPSRPSALVHRPTDPAPAGPAPGFRPAPGFHSVPGSDATPGPRPITSAQGRSSPDRDRTGALPNPVVSESEADGTLLGGSRRHPSASGPLAGDPEGASSPGGGASIRNSAASHNPLLAGPSGVSLTLEELCGASGLSPAEIADLKQFHLLAGRVVAGTEYFDEEELVVANLAARFGRFGIEPRHLRMYKTASEREAGFFEQLIVPLLKQRNPQARNQAMENLSELARLGQGLRASLLRSALRDHIR